MIRLTAERRAELRESMESLTWNEPSSEFMVGHNIVTQEASLLYGDLYLGPIRSNEGHGICDILNALPALLDAADERDRLAAAVRQIADACHWSHDPSDDPEALVAYIGQLQQIAEDACDEQGQNLAEQVERVRALHRPFGTYDECDCDDDAKAEGHDDVYEVGLTCNRLYSICAECCRDDECQSEVCANYHEHRPDEAQHCLTMRVLDGADDEASR